MSALVKQPETPAPWWSLIEFPWAETARRAPVMVATMASYRINSQSRPVRPPSVPSSRGCVTSPAKSQRLIRSAHRWSPSSVAT
jgi:hypothetical protein